MKTIVVASSLLLLAAFVGLAAQPAANQAPTRQNRLDGQAVGKKLSKTLGYLLQVLAVRPGGSARRS